MLTLSPRLSAAAAYALPGKPLADIGTDHAYLPVYLVQAGLIPRAIAADHMPGPLSAARKTVQEAGVAAQVELRQGSGLTVLAPGEAATVSICGMGGQLIADILAGSVPTGVERLVLQPMGGEPQLREWLAEHGWRLVAERLAEDAGRFYTICAAEPGAMRLTPAAALLGPCLLADGDPLLVRYVRLLLEQDRQALAGARQSNRASALAKVAELEERVQLFEEVLANGDCNHR